MKQYVDPPLPRPPSKTVRKSMPPSPTGPAGKHRRPRVFAVRTFPKGFPASDPSDDPISPSDRDETLDGPLPPLPEITMRRRRISAVRTFPMGCGGRDPPPVKRETEMEACEISSGADQKGLEYTEREISEGILRDREVVLALMSAHNCPWRSGRRRRQIAKPKAEASTGN